MNPSHEDRVVGLLDMVDITAFVIQLWGEKKKMKDVNFAQFLEFALADKAAKDVMNFSKLNNCVTLKEHSTFKDVLKVLSKHGTRRVPMLARGGYFDVKHKRPLARFLTQTDVIRFVATNENVFGASLDVSVGGCVGTYPAYCVYSTVKTIDAFQEMIERGVSAVGVCDPSSQLIGNLSVRDIVNIIHSTPSFSFTSTVGEFIAMEQLPENRPEHALTCHKGDSVRSVLETMNTHGIHRVYVIDEDDFPSGVISLTDLCRFLLTITSEKLVSVEKKNREKD
jgi:CBS domain-containing protein